MSPIIYTPPRLRPPDSQGIGTSVGDGTLWVCPECGRWRRYRCHGRSLDLYEWYPVRWYDVPARRRIAAHKSEKSNTLFNWWDCHPNPKRGRL